MDRASGWSLRFASWLLWAAILASCLQTGSLWLIGPFVAAFREDTASLHSASSILNMAPVTAMMLLPGVLHWSMAMDKTTSKSASALLKSFRKLPFWDMLLWLKTPARTLKALAFVLASACASHLCINLLLRNPALQSPGDRPSIPMLCTAPCGVSAALFVLSLQLDRPRFDAIHAPRLRRLRHLAPDIATTAVLMWLLAGIPTAGMYLATATPLPRFLDIVIAAAAALVYTAALLVSAVLAGLVLAERPGLPSSGADQSQVRLASSPNLCENVYPISSGQALQGSLL